MQNQYINLEKHVQEIAKGNLAIEPIKIKTKDEIGVLSKAINELKDTLTNLLMSLSDGANHLSATSEELTASTEEVSNASQVMLEVVKKGAESSSSMENSAKESATAMDETALAVQKISESSQVITGITEQTNLLALNAAIEAARAGEHGKGFAVVADEVRKLAEESNRSAGQIVALTNEIQQDTKNVEMAVQRSLDNVQEGVGIIENAGNSFDEIVNAISKMKAQIEDVSAVTEQISAAAEEVAASVTEIARSAELTNKNVQESFKSAETQRSSLKEVLSVASDLSKRAYEMQQIVSKYNY